MRVSRSIGFQAAIVGLLSGIAALPANAGEISGRVKGAERSPAVVYLVGVEGEIPAGAETSITHVKGGRFEPAVGIGFVGGEFVLRNEDDQMHTTHLYMQLEYQKELSKRPLEEGATLYNIALPMVGMEVRRPIRSYHESTSDTGFIDVRCNPHPDEHSALLVFSHPYATVTGKDGRFSLAGVPEGTHELWVWQQGKAQRWKSVSTGARLEIDPGEG